MQSVADGQRFIICLLTVLSWWQRFSGTSRRTRTGKGRRFEWAAALLRLLMSWQVLTSKCHNFICYLTNGFSACIYFYGIQCLIQRNYQSVIHQRMAACFSYLGETNPAAFPSPCLHQCPDFVHTASDLPTPLRYTTQARFWQ